MHRNVAAGKPLVAYLKLPAKALAALATHAHVSASFKLRATASVPDRLGKRGDRLPPRAPPTAALSATNAAQAEANPSTARRQPSGSSRCRSWPASGTSA